MNKNALLGIVMAVVSLASMCFSQQLCFADGSRMTANDKKQMENILHVMAVHFGSKNFKASDFTNHELIAFGITEIGPDSPQKMMADRYKISAKKVQAVVNKYFARTIRHESCTEYDYYYLSNGFYDVHGGDPGLGDEYSIVSTMTAGDTVKVLANGTDPETVDGSIDEEVRATFRKVTENGMSHFVLVSIFHKSKK